MRILALLAITLLVAGCIGPSKPAAQNDTRPGGGGSGEGDGGDAAPDTMTADATHEDTVERCNDDGQVPPMPFCAERHLVVTGILTLASLDVDLTAVNGGVVVRGVPGHTYTFEAFVRVRGATEDEARKNLDTQFAWSHTDGSAHFLKAGPVTPAGALPVDIPGAGSTADPSYVFSVPNDVVLALKGRWTNGGAAVTGVETTMLDLAGTNGGIELDASVVDLSAETTNGGVEGRIVPTASGTVTLKAGNGGVSVGVPEGSRQGYDISASATNGGVEILLRDGQVTGDEDSKRFTTRDHASRAIQTRLTAEVTNGGVIIA